MRQSALAQLLTHFAQVPATDARAQDYSIKLNTPAFTALPVQAEHVRHCHQAVAVNPDQTLRKLHFQLLQAGLSIRFTAGKQWEKAAALVEG